MSLLITVADANALAPDSFPVPSAERIRGPDVSRIERL